jgi:hypothetical protein
LSTDKSGLPFLGCFLDMEGENPPAFLDIRGRMGLTAAHRDNDKTKNSRPDKQPACAYLSQVCKYDSRLCPQGRPESVSPMAAAALEKGSLPSEGQHELFFPGQMPCSGENSP